MSVRRSQTESHEYGRVARARGDIVRDFRLLFAGYAGRRIRANSASSGVAFRLVIGAVALEIALAAAGAE